MHRLHGRPPRPILIARGSPGGGVTLELKPRPQTHGTVSKTPELVELPGLRVTVDRVEYQPDAQTPEDRPHCFAYFVSIRNDSDVTVTIKGRKWVVRNSRGEVNAVEGDGVVGQFPTLEPGEKFSYNSFHLIDAQPATAEGSYLGVTADERKVIARIPPFAMKVPE